MNASVVRWHRPLMYFAGAMAVTAVVSAIGMIVDDRILVGAPIWAKPLKFSISLLIYSVTWAWLMSLQQRWRRTGWWLGTVIVTASLIEMVVIVGQVVRGHRSHFNTLNPLDTVLWTTMGSSIAVLFFANLVWVVLLWRQPLTDAAVTTALRLGATLSLVGIGLGFLMTRPTDSQIAAMRADQPSLSGAHSVGVADGGAGLPLLGWSTTGGDLRIPHFVGMHALQLIPLVAAGLLLASRWLPRLKSDVVRRRLIWVSFGGYGGVIALVTWQALRGQSVVHPDGLTLTAAGGLLLAVVVAAAMGVVFPDRSGDDRRGAVAGRHDDISDNDLISGAVR